MRSLLYCTAITTALVLFAHSNTFSQAAPRTYDVQNRYFASAIFEFSFLIKTRSLSRIVQLAWDGSCFL